MLTFLRVWSWAPGGQGGALLSSPFESRCGRAVPELRLGMCCSTPVKAVLPHPRAWGAPEPGVPCSPAQQGSAAGTLGSACWPGWDFSKLLLSMPPWPVSSLASIHTCLPCTRSEGSDFCFLSPLSSTVVSPEKGERNLSLTSRCRASTSRPLSSCWT